jgi:hypothetical protein
VNGTAGGSAALGTVTKNEGDTSSGTYTAPAEKPSVNPVAVSVDLVRNETGKNTLRLVANVNVIGEGGPCKEVVPGLYTCKYRLTKWNGQDLPYTLPNDNPNSTATSRLTGGYLQLNTDEEGLVFGSGTYEIRYEYDHRPSGASQTMKQALNDVGKYLPRLATDDNTKFTSVSKVTYTGNITPEYAKVTNFPMSTETFSAPVTLEFVP